MSEITQWGSGFLNSPNKLLSSLLSQRNCGKYCDISLTFGKVELRAHTCVIASFSTFVDNLVSSNEVMQSGNIIQMRKVDVPLKINEFACVDCASKVIDFMYLGKIQINDEHLAHIQIVSEALQVSELLKICKKHSEKCAVIGKDSIESENHFPTATMSTITEESDLKDSIKSMLHVNEVLSKVSNLESEKETARGGTEGNTDKNSTMILDDVMDENEWSGMKCPKCDMVFLSLAKYQQHCSTHLGKTYTTCIECNYASIRVPDVIKHLQENNHGDKVCSLCLLEVSSNQVLKEHLQMHDQVQPFFCLTCSTRFQTRTALNSHIVRHTNETPFVCKECGRGFKWKHGLRSHMVTHSKLKTLLCDQCGFSTAHLKSFIDHKTIHSGEKFKCPRPDCQFKSVRKESVKHHLMTHSKQKPYQCEVCGQAFSQSKNLRRHSALHNPSADPERCPLCPFQTTRSDKFKAHFKRFHRDGEIEKQKKVDEEGSAIASNEVCKEASQTIISDGSNNMKRRGSGNLKRRRKRKVKNETSISSNATSASHIIIGDLNQDFTANVLLEVNPTLESTCNTLDFSCTADNFTDGPSRYRSAPDPSGQYHLSARLKDGALSSFISNASTLQSPSAVSTSKSSVSLDVSSWSTLNSHLGEAVVINCPDVTNLATDNVFESLSSLFKSTEVPSSKNDLNFLMEAAAEDVVSVPTDDSVVHCPSAEELSEFDSSEPPNGSGLQRDTECYSLLHLQSPLGPRNDSSVLMANCQSSADPNASGEQISIFNPSSSLNSDFFSTIPDGTYVILDSNQMIVTHDFKENDVTGLPNEDEARSTVATNITIYDLCCVTDGAEEGSQGSSLQEGSSS